MKKFFFTAAAILCALLLSVNLTSCGDDKDEPDMIARYNYGGGMENVQASFSYAEGDELTRKTYEELYNELKSILVLETWEVKYKKSNQDEVIKREDEVLKKKYADMEAKLMAFKAKVDKLDKTQDKYKFDFSMDVNIWCQREVNNLLTTLEQRKIQIKHKGTAD